VAGGATGIRPLIELQLFRSASFTWGTTLATLVSFAMFGIFFAMPLYFQEVRGVNAMGSGLRLLPMIGGMIIGMIGGVDFSGETFSINGSVFKYGQFINDAIYFVLVAAAVFFFIVKPYEMVEARRRKGEAEPAAPIALPPDTNWA